VPRDEAERSIQRVAEDADTAAWEGASVHAAPAGRMYAE
jgi:hypothetical protein